ncbi:hypothetical protein EVAR_45664_1 [Eumeta japonica]|uniref:Mos1 transposase HTH domain-containing protein n=1 Tax=Eumeta variegata TaxID=151549 RepID=A0A4C1Y759_EUMVA|nr:hypothetical protein EVAR_45664_1 [Eumeta japonica]
MDLTRENFLAIIYYDFRCGVTQKQCINQLTSTFGNEAPSKTTVRHWLSEFKRERFIFTDEFKEGHAKSVVLPQNVDAVQELIIQDRHITYREIKASLSISMMSINRTFHEDYKKNCLRWIPHNLSIEHKQNFNGQTSMRAAKELVITVAHGHSQTQRKSLWHYQPPGGTVWNY